jgi:CRISPR-associated protein Csm4
LKLYAISLEPLSGFGTPLKGDTLFGHFCWQAAYDSKLLNGGLDKWIACYAERPCVVFSSAFPYLSGQPTPYALKRPDLPRSYLSTKESKQLTKRKQVEVRKENNKKRWILQNKMLDLNLEKLIYRTDADLARMITGEQAAVGLASSLDQPHNTINRLSMTTGEGPFAPFTETVNFYAPRTELALFVLVDEEATDLERVLAALRRMGQFGYGKNASTGLGRFRLGSLQEKVALSTNQVFNACYALAPVVPKTGIFRKTFFQPFVRFGKHGDQLACSAQPFKNPVIMADEGAVLLPANREEVFSKPYIGTAVGNVSKALKPAVVQGYAPYIPFKLEVGL